MKKIILLVLTLVLCLGLMSFAANATEPSATLTGPSTVRAGNTITLTFSLTGSDIYLLEGNLNYDPDQVTFISQKQLIGSPWKLEDINGNSNKVLTYDDELSTPINSTTKLFTLTFKVKQLKVGTRINISIDNVQATVGYTLDAKTVSLGSIGYSVSVAAPMSTNNKLQKLNVSNAELQPKFDPDVTSYTASVPFSVDKLIIDAVAADSAAKVDLSNNPTLTPDGTTKVTITVTAESGSKKVYTITVTRAKDPNYQPSGNNNLSGISVGIVPLSPHFNKETTNYVLWLPYEVEEVTVSATTEHSKATVRVEGGKDLIAGADNEIKVICTAENGEEKVYTLIAKRAAPTIPNDTTGTTNPPPPITSTNTQTQPTEPLPTDPKPTDTKPTDSKPTASQPSGGSDSEPTNILLIIIYCIIGIIAGFLLLVLLLFIISMRRKGRYAMKKKNRR